VVSNVAGVLVHVPPPLGRRSYVVLLTPEPASLVVEVSVIVPRTVAASEPIVADGAVLSIRRPVTALVVWFPALSVTTTRRS
jgi:hypothetical protein